jgi:hypothetical protein
MISLDIYNGSLANSAWRLDAIIPHQFIADAVEKNDELLPSVLLSKEYIECPL